MALLDRFATLSHREKALVCTAVLLDGYDGAGYLLGDKERTPILARLASELASLPAEVRIPLMGTLLRESLQQVS